MSEPEIITPEAKKLSTQAENYVTVADGLQITTHGQYQDAGGVLKQIKAKAKELTDTRLSITRPMDEAKKKVMAFFKTPLDFLTSAEGIIKPRMISFNEAEEKKRRADEEKVRKEAEKEAAYQAKLAEKRAQTQEKYGKTEEAEAIREEVAAAPVVVPIPSRERPKAAGVAMRTTWSAEVTDKMALIKAVAAGQVPPSVLDANMKVLNGMARSLKRELNYDGVKAVASKGIAA